MSVELVGGVLLGLGGLAAIIFVLRRRAKAKAQPYTQSLGPITKDDMFRFLASSKFDHKPMANIHDYLPDQSKDEWPHDPKGDPEKIERLRQLIEDAKNEVPRKENKDI